jgi:tetratricopeptide (TPR) repeat protein
MTPQSIRARLEESLALVELGLRDEAAALIDRLLCEAPCQEVYATAVQVFNRLGRFARASVCAQALLESGEKLSEEMRFRISLAFQFAGRVKEAYEIEKAITPESNDTALVRLYGLACKASRLGHYGDALNYLLSSFHFQNNETWDAHRKLFLDSELAGLWEKIPTLPISLREAMRFCNLPFDKILKDNESPSPLRCVDYMDFHTMPGRFRPLLQPAYETSFEVNPLAEAKNPGLFADYVRWQESIVAPRLATFRALGARLCQMVVDQQLDFATFQAKRGRISCARNHLISYLQRSPEASLDNLPDIPVMRPLVAELRAQFQECPTSFRYLISWACREEPETFIRDVHPEMPEINRNSGYALLALGCMHYRLGNTAAALESWSACARKWPLDDAPVMNATMLLSGEQRWDEATRLINHLPGECRDSMLWKRATHAIREHLTFTISNKIHTTPVIPTPTFGNLYSGADEEFLREKHKFTAITC